MLEVIVNGIEVISGLLSYICLSLSIIRACRNDHFADNCLGKDGVVGDKRFEPGQGDSQTLVELDWSQTGALPARMTVKR